MSHATTTMALFLQIIITCFLFTATASSSPHGFTIDLHHRRYNSSSSRLSKTDDYEGLGSPYANTFYDTNIAAYVMKLQIGTPPFEIEAMLDTGSDLLWTQCVPCVNCFNQAGPIFDPSKSSTFKECHQHDHPCDPYEIVYADKSYSKGIWATDTVTIPSTSGEPFVMPNTIIGCGHNNSAIRDTMNTSGVVGLNCASWSLTSQMGEDYLGLLSYCFSGQGTSKINFGSNAIVAGDGVVSADMFRKADQPNFYYLNLDAISVGDNRVDTIGTPFHASDGNMFIDSGTTYNYLPEPTYCNQVKDAVASVVTAERVPLQLIEDMLCYNTDSIENLPVITMHFAGNADLVMDRYNTYIEYVQGTYCFNFICNDQTTKAAIFGNRAQNNFLVGYDPSSTLISFKPTDCSALWS